MNALTAFARMELEQFKYIANFPSRPNGYPASWVLEEADTRTRWVVKPSERDDRKGESVVERYGRAFE